MQNVAADELAASRNLVRDLRSLTVRRDGEMARLNGWFDIEAGERILAGLDPGPPAEGDDRSAPMRRADLLIDVLNGASDRPHLLVHVSADTLIGGLAGTAETSNLTVITSEDINRLSCDAIFARIVLGPGSQPLDVGRMKRLVTPAIRAAVVARDLRCVFPGCDRHERWCDVHHLLHWRDGGETKVENLVLFCRYHHILIHDHGWQISGAPDAPRFHRPDGSPLATESPPRRRADIPSYQPDPPPPEP